MATPQEQFVLDLVRPIRELTEILEREARRLNPPALSVVRNDDQAAGDDG